MSPGRSVFLLLFVVWLCSETECNVNEFGRKIVQITETILGTKRFKTYLHEEDQFRSKPLRGDAVVKKLSMNVNDKISSRETAVKRLRHIVTNAYQQHHWGKYKDCCSYSQQHPELSYDARFLGKVDINSLCTITSSLAVSTDDVPSEQFLNAAVTNLEDFPGIKAQYFGSDNGTLLNFPATAISGFRGEGSRGSRMNPFHTFRSNSAASQIFLKLYVQASAPVPKDIVILVDMSGSMNENHRLEAAIHAANTILGTLSPDDRVAVVAFSHYAYAVGSEASFKVISQKKSFSTNQRETTCYDYTMLAATPKNLHHLISYVSNMVPHGDTNYTKGLEKAFDFLQEAYIRDVASASVLGKSNMTEVAYSRHRAIVFLSDGMPSDRPSNVLKLIYKRNRRMQNSVVLLCYALGKGTFGKFIQRMSEQTYVDTNADVLKCNEIDKSECLPPPRRGLFRQVVDSRNLRSEMGSYYNYFATAASESHSIYSKNTDLPVVKWSVPYFDAFGMGMIFTAASPIVVEGNLLGVVGVDLTMRELMTDISFFHAGGLASYAFLFDLSGRILIHPYMPSPSTVKEDPILTGFEAFERSPLVVQFLNEIIEDVKTKKQIAFDQHLPPYQKAIMTKRALPQAHRNVELQDAYLEYFCMPVQHLIVCVVVQSEIASNTEIKAQSLPNDFTFVYHRFDISPPDELCIYDRSLSSGNRSSVFLAPSAFCDVGKHLGHPESSTWIRDLRDYMYNDEMDIHITGIDSCQKINLLSGIRDAVRLTAILDNIWNSEIANSTITENTDDSFPSTAIGNSVIYRYFSTDKGVFRIFPGVQMPKRYNPLHRPWYEQAQSFFFHHELTSKECKMIDYRECSTTAAVSPPYLDASGAGIVVTISQAIASPNMQNKENHDNDEIRHIFGVMGGDIKLKVLGNVLTQSVKECKNQTENECILMDLSGYVIYDNALSEMDETTMENILKTNYHVTFAHPLLAYELVKYEFFKREKCSDVSQIAYLEEYRFDPESLKDSNKGLPFEIFYINQTNMIVLIVPVNFQSSNDGASCVTHDQSNVRCRDTVDDGECESPCINIKDAFDQYGVCRNSYNYSWELHPPPCVPKKFIDEKLALTVEINGNAKIDDPYQPGLQYCFEETKPHRLRRSELGSASATIIAGFVAIVFLLLKGISSTYSQPEFAN